MKVFQKIWNNFKSQPDTWFFYVFFAASTLSIRKVIYNLPVTGQFNEYTGAYLYLSDVFFGAFLFLWIIVILKYKKLNLSRLIASVVSRETFLKNWFVILPLALVILSFISALWADNKIIAIFRSFKILEFFIVYVYVIWRLSTTQTREISEDNNKFDVSRETLSEVKKHDKIPFLSQNNFLNNIVVLTIGIGLVNSIIAIAQFFIQGSIELTVLRESIISPDIAGVAKIVINGHKLIRGYGLFPHPNILGGFLLFSLLLTFGFKKVNFSNIIVSYGTEHQTASRNVSREVYFYLAMAIQFFALLLTFSKSAFLGLIIAFIYLLAKRYGNLKYALNKAKVPFLVVVVILLVALIFVKVDLNSFIYKSVIDRLDQFRTFMLVVELPDKVFHVEQFSLLFFGLGMGQYVNQIITIFNSGLEAWQYQPVHNVYLLIFGELGFIGLAIFSWFLWKLFQQAKSYNVSRETFIIAEKNEINILTKNSNISESNKNSEVVFFWNIKIIIKGALAGFLVIMLFDHYLWDIQQGQSIFWLLIAILVGINTSLL